VSIKAFPFTRTCTDVFLNI